MNEFIRNILAGQDIPFFYVKRQHNTFPCVVFNYNESTLSRSDNKEELALYDCYFNIYCKENLTANTNKIKKVLEDAGFQKVMITAPEMFDGDDFYQIVLNYNRWL